MSKYQCMPQDATRIKEWLAKRGGILVWKSINLSNMGASWTTPALRESGQRVEKPTWQADNLPALHITDPVDVEVVVPREVKRFRVAVRRADFALKVTDSGTRRIRAAVEKAGEGAWYEFDYSTQEVLILVPDKVVPLPEWRP